MNSSSVQRTLSPRLCTLLALAAGSCFSHCAHATILSWLNAAGGSAATPTNWNPNQIPTSADDLQFNLNAAYNVTFPVSLTTGRTLLVNRGTVSATFSNFTTTSSITVAQTAGNSANFNIVGSLASQNFFTLAVSTNTTVNSTINGSPGAASLVQLTGSGGDALIGQGGTATLQIANNSQFLITQNADDFIIGNLASGIGTVIVRSTTVSPALLTMNTASTTSDLVVGGSGQGTLELESNSQTSLSANCFIALSPGSTGIVTLGDGLGIAPPVMEVMRDLHVGHNTSGVASGTGSLTIDDESSVVVGNSNSFVGTTFIGDPNGGSGTLTLNSGIFSTENLVIDPTNGSLDHTGGTLELRSGGSFSSTRTLGVDGTNINSPPIVEVIGNTTTLNGGFRVGARGLGVLNVRGGSTLRYTFGPGVTSGGKMIGEAESSRGEVTITGTGTTFHETTTIPTLFIIGNRGNGTLRVSDRASFRTNGSLTVGLNSTSTGLFDITDQAEASVSGTLSIGDEIGAGGNGSLTMSNGGMLTVNSLTVHRTGSANTSNSTINASNTITILNQMTAANSTLGALVTGVEGSLSATGTINSRLSIASTGTLNVANGTLTAGQSTSEQGFISDGLIILNLATLNILDGNNTPMGNLSSGGGTINASHRLDFKNLAIIGGTCVFNAPSQFLSTEWIPGNAFGGLVFNAPVDATSITSTGGTVTLAAGSYLAAAGQINSTIVTEEEAPIIATGDLELGSNAVSNAINLAGHLIVGTHRVNLYSNTSAQLGTLTTLAGGTLDGPDGNPRIIDVLGNQFTVFDSVPLNLSAGNVIEGFGTILTQIRTFAGSRLTLTGNLTMEGSSLPPLLPVLGNTFVTWDGLLEVGPHTLTINREHRPAGITTINGGTIICPTFTNFGTLQGRGTIESTLNPTFNAGTLTFTSQTAQDMTILGGFINSSIGNTRPGIINMRIGGDQGEENDRLIIATGDLTLGGTLEVTTFGLAPDPNYLYEIIIVQSGTMSGQFEEVILPPGMTIQYDEGRVYITAICFADFNQDGGIDGSDIDAFFIAWEAGDFSADVNDDGGVDGSDVSDFFLAWEAGAC